MSAVRIARRHRFQCLSPGGQNFSPRGPTHNYEIEAYIEGEMNRTGMVMNVRDLDALLGASVKPFIEKPLAESSSELAEKIFATIRTAIGLHNARLVKLRLYESPDLWFEVWP